MNLYRHKGLNSLYMLQPGTQNIYLLDFKKQSFIKEQIKSESLLVSNFSSVQTTSGKIYMVGGLVKDLVLKNTFVIDEYLQHQESTSMKTGRFCAPVTLLKDNFILAAGGQTKNQVKKYTNSVEIFDISKNEWSTLNSMQRPRGNTSLTAINDRFVYIFNGLSSPNI